MIYWFVSRTRGSGSPALFSRSIPGRPGIPGAGWCARLPPGRLGSFSLTPDEKKCLYCVYRSLCNRGIKAGNWQEQTDEQEPRTDLELPFEQIGEIEF